VHFVFVGGFWPTWAEGGSLKAQRSGALGMVQGSGAPPETIRFAIPKSCGLEAATPALYRADNGIMLLPTNMNHTQATVGDH